MRKTFLIPFVIIILTYCLTVFGQSQNIPFDSDKWAIIDGEKVEFLGRNSFKGIATLKEIQFENGIIEFDMAVTGERSYPGIVFRMINRNEYERIYIRPHLSKVFQNVVQYEGTFNGLDSWQLYFGPGKSASAEIPVNKWFHVKVEVLNNQARLFLNEQPIMFIKELVHGVSKGTIGVWGPNDGSAYFSNFSFEQKNDLQFPSVAAPDIPLGMIEEWELSNPLKLNQVDYELLPEIQGIKDLKWRKVKSLASGLVDVSRFYGRVGQTPDIIWAKTNISSDKNQTKQYAFGYSDIICIFLNGKLLFTGNSSYMSRDGNFQGIVGLNDFIFLPLQKGNNELVIALVESFGGWGFMFQDVNAIYTHSSLSKQWEVKNKFNYPESAVYDKKRDMIYVSNYTYESNGFISKVKTNGEIEKLNWINGIYQPTGLCIVNNKLYVVGRYNLIEIDIEKNAISNRYPFPTPIFANDIAADNDGTIYITDGGKGAIYKFEKGQISEWLMSPELLQVNGIAIDEDKIIAGISKDGSIKSIDIKTKEIKNIFSLAPGVIMDGIAKDGRGNYLIGDHVGRIFRITKEGKSQLLLNTKPSSIQIADFEFVQEKGLIVIPTLEDNRLMVYKMDFSK